jgi:hypothetical protein
MIKRTGFLLSAVLALFPLCAAHAQAKRGDVILPPAVTAKITPATVFFRGQSAPMQLRNTFGVRTADGAVVLMGLVDSSGYSSGIQQKYQGYILTEVALNFSGKHLAPGAYAFGFVGANAFTVMDLGNHDLLSVPWATDANLHRPRPLQIVQGAQAQTYRLYAGRKYVDFALGK